MKKAHLHLIKWGLSKGYTISVYIEGEYEGRYTSYVQAKEAVEAGDMGYIVLQEDMYDAAVFDYMFDWGQEPDEIISDMTDNKIARQWLKDYEEDNSIDEREVVTNNNYVDDGLDAWDIK
tara:strand:- start:436 stop:795 length:360 start_codon:yes stop_codon:yes gene_type:complete